MVCKTCKATGANFFKAAERSAGIIEDKIDIERELSSIMVQKRFEGRVIASSPFGLILMIKILSPDYMAPLYETTLGRAVSTISLAVSYTHLLQGHETDRKARKDQDCKYGTQTL